MAEYTDREHFIPLDRTSVVELCAEHSGFEGGEARDFSDVCRLLEATLHFEYHGDQQQLIRDYGPWDPDADTVTVTTADTATLVQRRQDFADGLKHILSKANYTQVPESELDSCLSDPATVGLELDVPLDEFEELLVYSRGEMTRVEERRRWFGLKRYEQTVPCFRRLALFIQFKGADYFPDKAKLPFVPGSTYLKLFKDVPRADLEVLFPNARARMKVFDKLVIGVPAVAGTAFLLITKLGATLVLALAMLAFWLGLSDHDVTLGSKQLLALGLGMGTLGAHVGRQFSRFKTLKLRFMKELSEHLYYRNLDNNAGVIHHLVEAAETEELKEALIAYTFLATRATPCTEAELDDEVEAWFEARCGVKIDFEIDDALQKLDRFGLLLRDGDQLRCLPPAEAKVKLDYTWDHFFEFNGA